MVKIEIGKVMNLKRITKNNQPTKFPFVVTSEAGFGAGTPQQEAVPKGQEFSRIENLWPRDDSCSQLIRSKQLLRNCFQIVKTHKASKEPFSSEVVVFTVSTTTFLFCFSCKRVRNMVYRLYETLLRLNNLTFNDV